MTYRRARVGDLIRDVLSEIVQRESKDPRLQRLFAITDVQVSADLKHARVFVSVLGEGQDKNEVLRGLTAAAGFLRHELGERTTLRYTPELDFILDESIERGARILQLLREIGDSDEKRNVGSPGEEQA